jgi:hypothetical protein
VGAAIVARPIARDGCLFRRIRTADPMKANARSDGWRSPSERSDVSRQLPDNASVVKPSVFMFWF